MQFNFDLQTQSISARYVRVLLLGSNQMLNICEIEARGYLDPPRNPPGCYVVQIFVFIAALVKTSFKFEFLE